MASGTTEYWREKWDNQPTPSFHQDDMHPSLLALESKLFPEDRKLWIFVPLCGRAPELKHFLDKGYRVIGIEISERAIRDFGIKNNLNFKESTIEDFGKEFVSENGQVRIFCGDIFKFGPEMLPKEVQIGAVMDRGSAVALPPELRHSYFKQMKRFCSYEKCKYFISLSDHDIPNCPHPQIFPVEEVCVTLGQVGFRLIEYSYGKNFDGLGAEDLKRPIFAKATKFKENGFLFSKEMFS